MTQTTTLSAAEFSPVPPDALGCKTPPNGCSGSDSPVLRFRQQFEQVKQLLRDSGAYSKEVIDKAALDYYSNLGLNTYYFKTSSAKAVAGHLSCLMAANILHSFSNEEFFPLIHQKRDDEVVVISRASLNNRCASQNYAVEKMLEDEYLHLDGLGHPWRLQGYRSVKSVFDDASSNEERLRTCFLQPAEYEEPNDIGSVESGEDNRDLSRLCDKNFWKHNEGTPTAAIFDALNSAVIEDHMGLSLYVHEEPWSPGVHRIDFAFRRAVGQKRLYSTLGDIVTAFGMFSRQKYVEPLRNGVSIITCFVQLTNEIVPEVESLSLEVRIQRLIGAARMQHIFPASRYNELCLSRALRTLEASYCHAASQFVCQFSQEVGPAFAKIAGLLDQLPDVPQQELYDVRMRLKQSPFTEESIFSAVQSYPDIARRLYLEFRENHHPESVRELIRQHNCEPSALPYQASDKTLEEDIQKLDTYDAPRVFSWFLRFNRAIRKTNFFNDDRIALAFRCDASFLPASDYPTKPYALIFFTGNSFRGFHCRFADIARGGIRVVASTSRQMFHKNAQQVFDEVYNLCATQNFKNKDIPEGGSKGVILLDRTNSPEETARLTRQSFMRYIDAFLDILLPSDHVVDRLGVPEVCFLGPDENTGTGRLMDWAALHARRRGAWFWKAFTTGKEPVLGGIPHDTYGMTTTSVETYVRGCLQKLNLKEEEATKCQTGGPDGDLGSNSIRMSRTKLTSLVDGGGVVADPEGLDRDELLRLVQRRFDGLPTDSTHFDASKLSPKGFKVSVSDKEVTLPDGTVVMSGLQFRNEFHLHPLSTATLFNPNGGRPASVTPFNMDRLFFKDGKPRFPIIIEGANVFITEDARIALEKRGVSLFKDASTNKGGVTSSSFEVLAALALDDESFQTHMSVRDPKCPPQFYQDYVNAVKEIITTNAELEFELLWREKERTKKPVSQLIDIISGKIIEMKSELLGNRFLWDDTVLRENVLRKAIPNVLVPSLVDIQTLMDRVPESYLQALFASYVSSKFYYTYGLESTGFSFMQFISELRDGKKA